MENRFRRIKSDAKQINQAVADGIDVITINVGDTSGAVANGGSASGKKGQARSLSLLSQHTTYSCRAFASAF